MLIGIGILIGVTFAETNQENNQQPPNPVDYPKEYAITGLTDDGLHIKLRGYGEGWLTKPLRAHTVSNWPPPDGASAAIAQGLLTIYPDDVRDLPTANRIDFFKSTDGLTIAKNGNAGNIEGAINAYTGTKRSVPKNYCYENNQMRSGSNAIRNDAFCLDYKPPAGYADTNIGALTSEAPQVLDGQIYSESYTVNRAWTDASAPGVPQYPALSGRQGAAWGNRPELWHYQLVYNRDDMNFDSNTKLPVKLWDTDYLSLYFSKLTIRQMRIYYCTSTFKNDASGASIDDRCWGYLNIALPKYKFLRMTIPGFRMSAPTTTTQSAITGSIDTTTDTVTFGINPAITSALSR